MLVAEGGTVGWEMSIGRAVFVFTLGDDDDLDTVSPSSSSSCVSSLLCVACIVRCSSQFARIVANRVEETDRLNAFFRISN